MRLSYQTPLWFYPMPVDFRRQIDGLMIVVADQLERIPTSGELFIFRNRKFDKIKLLWYERNGFWLCYRRLEAGRFQYPIESSTVMELNHDQLSWLLSGLDITQLTPLPSVTASRFY